MKINWPLEKLENVVAPGKGMLVSGPFGSNISSKFFVESGVPVIRGNNLTKGKVKYIDDGYVYITDEKARELNNCNAIRDDILITAAGTLGQVGILTGKLKHEKYIISNKQIRLRCDSTKILPLFLYYFLSWEYMSDFLASQNKGSSIPLLTLGSIKWIPVALPPIDSQNKIISILSTYDDLIEKNLKRMKLLEEMAQITYEEWFVRMKFPGHETTTFDEKIGLPKGWKKGRFKDLFELQRGFDLPVQERGEGAFPIIASTGEIGTHSIAKVKGPGVVTGRSGTIGEVTFCQDDFWPLNTSLWLKKVNYGGPVYAYLFLKGFNLERLSGGSAVPSLDRKVVHSQSVNIPPKELCEQFESLVFSSFRLKSSINKQNELLIEARNILLPRLMTGMIDIEQVELPEAILKKPEQQEDEIATA